MIRLTWVVKKAAMGLWKLIYVEDGLEAHTHLPFNDGILRGIFNDMRVGRKMTAMSARERKPTVRPVL